MATTAEFLAELAAHKAQLDAQLAELGRAIAQHAQAIDELQAKRTARLDELVEELLPSLRPGDLQRLSQRIPDFASPESVARLRDDMVRVYRSQLQHIESEFDPKTWEARQLDLEAQVSEAQTGVDDLEGPFEKLTRETEIERLVNCGYGTTGYARHWYDFLRLNNLNYFRDWAAADKAMEACHVQTWREAATRFEEQRSALQLLRGTRDEVTAKLQALEAARQSHASLTSELEHVSETVLNRLRTQLRARLDGLDPAPAWMSEVGAWSAQVVRLQQELSSLRELQARLTTEQTNVLQATQQVRESGKGEINDRYLEALQASRRSAWFPSSGTSTWSGPVIVHTHESSGGFFSGMLFQSFLDELGRRPEPTYRRDTWREQTYRQARSDSSGQS